MIVAYDARGLCAPHAVSGSELARGGTRRSAPTDNTRVWRSRKRVSCAFRVWGQGFRVKGQGSRVKGQGFRVKGQGFRVKGQGSRVRGFGSRVKGQGSRVWDVGWD
eukprot:654793-Rhodomonas_salina.1